MNIRIGFIFSLSALHLMPMKIESVFRYQGHKDALFALGVHPQTGHIWSGGGDGFIVEWIPMQTDGQLISKLPRPVYSFQSDSKTKQLLAGTASGNLHFIDLIEKKELRNIEGHTLGLFDIKQTGDLLLTAGGDGRINTWDITNFSLLQSWAASDKACRVMAINKEGNLIAAGYSDNFIRLFKIESGRLSQMHEWEAHTNSVFALAFNPITGELWSGGRDAMLKVWNTNYELLADIPAHNYHINAISFSPDGALAATVSMDKTLKIWESKSQKLLKVADRFKMDAHTNSVNKVVWLNNEELVSAGDDRLLFHWKIS